MSRRSLPTRLRAPWAEDRHFGPVRPIMLGVWLLFILVPIVNALGRSGQTPARHWLVVAGALAFSGTYIGVILIMFGDRRPLELTLCGLLVTLAVALTVGDESSWSYLFVYCAACAAMVLPSTPGFAAVLVTAGITVGATASAGGSFVSGLGLAASVIGVGFLLMLLRDLRVRNAELSDARAALANVAVAAERERFARDLHDLLGHSLSVIAIKAELAGRLLPGAPDRAAGEVADVEAVARQALGEVRDAVSGYRQPTLAGELEGARMALSAAGIEASFEADPVSLDPAVEAVLAWTVREGATNVIRHSGATRCSVRIRSDAGDAGVEVVDDGAGADGSPVPGPLASGGDIGGNGLAGLRERAAGLRGRIEAGTAPDGGYRLAVSVPVSAGPTGADPR
ncbi:MAG: sensor histidine kinase [Solirubrobacteraceae bacterium]